jgi:hypothetical protein
VLWNRPSRRYQCERPGELIHIDIKRLGKIGIVGHRITGDRSQRGRGIGWEYVHVCIDDASRIAFIPIKPDERKRSAVAFLKAAVAYYASLGVKIERVMTDNAPATNPMPSAGPANASVCATSGPDHRSEAPSTFANCSVASCGSNGGLTPRQTSTARVKNLCHGRKIRSRTTSAKKPRSSSLLSPSKTNAPISFVSLKAPERRRSQAKSASVVW